MIRKSCITSHPVSAGCYKRKRFKLFSSTFFTTLGVEFLTSCDVVILNKKMAAIFTKMDEKWWRIFKETLNEKWWMMCSLRKGKWKWIGLFFSWEKEKKLKKKSFCGFVSGSDLRISISCFFCLCFLKEKAQCFLKWKLRSFDSCCVCLCCTALWDFFYCYFWWDFRFLFAVLDASKRVYSSLLVNLLSISINPDSDFFVDPGRTHRCTSQTWKH